MPKSMKGIGTRHIKDGNVALLFKWLERFGEECGVWEDMIVAKCVIEAGGWFSKTIKTPYRCCGWES